MADFQDVFQHYESKNAQAAANDLRDAPPTEPMAPLRELKRVEARLDGLSLVTQALVELMHAQGVSPKTIIERVREIDLRDGKLDGRMTPKARA